ncbi:MAG: HU family DNA-binding protein [Sphingopyxis sp.]
MGRPFLLPVIQGFFYYRINVFTRPNHIDLNGNSFITAAPARWVGRRCTTRNRNDTTARWWVAPPFRAIPAIWVKKMIRSELVQRLVAENPTLRPTEIEAVADTFFETIIGHLSKGGRVELRGFGAFSTRARDARDGRNPRTGDAVAVPAKNVPYFKAGKDMREHLNSD